MSISTVPAVWQQLAGQSKAIASLTRPEQLERPTHAWLFTGPPGSGRSTAARAFAQALQCEQEDLTQRGCGVCPSCVTVGAGTHADVKIMSTERVNYAIEEIRELVAEAQDRPATGRWRIFIIEDADRMTERATNVLLKAIEEPPARTIWMLCAPSPADVLITIRSRTRNVNLVIPSVEEVTDLLINRDGASPELAAFAAQASQSHVGIARWLARSEEARARRESIVNLPLDVRSAAQATAAAQELVTVTQQEAEASASDRNEAEKTSLMRSLGLEPEATIPPKLRHHVRRLEEEHTARNRRSVHDALDRAMIDLSGVFRDILLIQLTPDQVADAALINPHMREKLVGYAQRTTAEHCLGALDAITTARSRLGGNVPPLLALEAMLLAFIPRTRTA